MVKQCLICEEDFNTIPNGGSRLYCFECSPSCDPSKNANYVINARRKAVKKMLVNKKGGKCEICGYNKSLRALQFHHIDSKEKDFVLSHLTINKNNIIKSKNEIEKCQLLCANCHAELHEEKDLQFNTI